LILGACRTKVKRKSVQANGHTTNNINNLRWNATFASRQDPLKNPPRRPARGGAFSATPEA